MLCGLAAPGSDHLPVRRLYRMVITKFAITKKEMAELDGEIGAFLEFAECDDDDGPGN
jgi:hypothetical protein